MHAAGKMNDMLSYDFRLALAMYEGTELISLYSDEGRKLLAQSDDSFYNAYIHHIFAKQVGRSNCGIQSAALLMSSDILAKRYPGGIQSLSKDGIPFTESSMFTFEATTKVATEDYIRGRGLTLEESTIILRNHGKSVKAFYSSDSTVDEFRTLACEALKNTKNGSGIMVNYHMGDLGQGSQWRGHFSPLGAYHTESDRFLIFDTWPDTEECWAKSDELFKSMQSTDPYSNLARGFLVMYCQN